VRHYVTPRRDAPHQNIVYVNAFTRDALRRVRCVALQSARYYGVAPHDTAYVPCMYACLLSGRLHISTRGLAVASIARDVVVKITPPRDDNAR